jgi:hypothetical protein
MVPQLTPCGNRTDIFENAVRAAKIDFPGIPVVYISGERLREGLRNPGGGVVFLQSRSGRRRSWMRFEHVLDCCERLRTKRDIRTGTICDVDG